MSKQFAVCGILPIINGFYLSVSRKDDPNKIGFIGGKVDKHEDTKSALIREAYEETGLHVAIEDHLPFIDTDGDFTVSCYMLRLLDIPHEQIEEHETGIIRIASKIQLCKASPYGKYNTQAFEWFNIE